jgi:hypothetical protein
MEGQLDFLYTTSQVTATSVDGENATMKRKTDVIGDLLYAKKISGRRRARKDDVGIRWHNTENSPDD